MKRKCWVPFLIPLISFAQIPSTRAADLKNVENLNKKTVIAFYDLAFNQHKPTEAAKKYFGSKYIQHNPMVPNGAAAFYTYFEEFYKTHPKAHVKIHRAVAEGDLVFLHLHSKIDDQDTGRAVVDIFRLENGKIVEHFDVAQSVPEKTANGNTMFEGSKEN